MVGIWLLVGTDDERRVTSVEGPGRLTGVLTATVCLKLLDEVSAVGLLVFVVFLKGRETVARCLGFAGRGGASLRGGGDSFKEIEG